MIYQNMYEMTVIPVNRYTINLFLYDSSSFPNNTTLKILFWQ